MFVWQWFMLWASCHLIEMGVSSGWLNQFVLRPSVLVLVSWYDLCCPFFLEVSADAMTRAKNLSSTLCFWAGKPSPTRGLWEKEALVLKSICFVRVQTERNVHYTANSFPPSQILMECLRLDTRMVLTLVTVITQWLWHRSPRRSKSHVVVVIAS